MTGGEAVIRWGSTVAFVAFFSAALYTVGATWAPWIGAIVAGGFAASLWVKHMEDAGNAQARAEGQSVRRFQAREDVDTSTRQFRAAEEPAPPQSSAAASYYDDEDDD